MSLPGERTKPTSGMKGSKGGPGSQPRQRLPPDPDLAEQSAIYLRERNKAMKAKRLRAEMELAQARDRLIEKRLAERQLEFMLISLRQKILAVDGKVLLALRTKPELTPHEIAQTVRRLALEALEEVANLPEVADPNWLKRVEDEET